MVLAMPILCTSRCTKTTRCLPPVTRHPPPAVPAAPHSPAEPPAHAHALLTVADWRAASLADGAPTARLAALAEHLHRAHADSPAWITLATPAQVRAQAEAIEARGAALPDVAAVLRAMPLFGVPFAVKDNIDVEAWPTTAACPAFSRTAHANATVVERLQAAGAVCMGKTNLDQFATGLVGTRSPYGRPASTFAADRVSGGSSSGSAVVVASGQVAFALGTDTAGSGRIPAGFNHIVGLKPTPGRVSTHGVLPACRSLDCISIMALTVGDAAEVLAAMEGADAADAYSHFAPGPAELAQRPGGALRVGVPAAPRFGSTPGYAEAWRAAVAHVESLGHTVVPLDFEPLHAVAELLYGGPWVAERHTVVQTLLERNPDAFDPTVRRVIEAARGYTATDAFRGQYRLADARQALAATWHRVDLLMVPTAPAHPSLAEVDADPVGANAQLGHYTNFVNLLGWCALALPFGFTPAEGVAGPPQDALLPSGDGHRAAVALGSSRLPFGVTFIAPGQHDAALARFGLRWQASLPTTLGATGVMSVSKAGHHAAPATWPASEATLALAVVGAHLSGLPLNGQLTGRGATLRETTHTAPSYRLFALPNTTPPKPGLQRVASGGAAIAVEVWNLPLHAVGSFLALVPAPLGLGSVELADGRWVNGFICEGHALAAAQDVTAHGGWRAYLAYLASLHAAPSR